MPGKIYDIPVTADPSIARFARNVNVAQVGGARISGHPQSVWGTNDRHEVIIIACANRSRRVGMVGEIAGICQDVHHVVWIDGVLVAICIEGLDDHVHVLVLV